jgi:hypothetical protein
VIGHVEIYFARTFGAKIGRGELRFSAPRGARLLRLGRILGARFLALDPHSTMHGDLDRIAVEIAHGGR